MLMIHQEKGESMSIKTPWTTFDELQFVAHLETITPAIQRKQILRGYLAGLRRRVRWEGIDAGVVREAAESALEGLQ
jgi:hypothetical protein